MPIENRIFFKNNPYPNGHRLKEFEWSARLEPATGVWFDFHLQTEEYYAEDETGDDAEGEPPSDWQAKIVWGNYHACTMSSTQWHTGGILVGTESGKLDFDSLTAQRLTADPLPIDWNEKDDLDDFAFLIYLLGHDSCAGHEITFPARRAADCFDINWTGKIALTYAGASEFAYDFAARAADVQFAGIEFPADLAPAEAHNLLAKFVVRPEAFEISGGWLKLKN